MIIISKSPGLARELRSLFRFIETQLGLCIPKKLRPPVKCEPDIFQNCTHTKMIRSENSNSPHDEPVGIDVIFQAAFLCETRQLELFGVSSCEKAGAKRNTNH